MVDRRNVAVIDIGKTNAKLALIDMETLSEIAVLKEPNHVLPGPPYPHYDVDALWNFIVRGLREFQRTQNIDAITVTTHGACAALLDRNGDLAVPILDYEHDGPETTADDYDRLRPDFSKTGSPRLPLGLNLGGQIFWQFSTFPDIRQHTATIVTYPQYWTARLTGIAVNEVTSLGCHTDLWNPNENEYSSLVDNQGWKLLMAPVRRAADLIGSVLPEIATEIGLKPDTPVYCGIHDSNASLYPHLLNRKAPFSVVSTGTWVISMAIGGEGVALDPTRDTLINVNGFGQRVPSSRFMGGREFEILMKSRAREYQAQDVEKVLQNKMMLMPSVEPGSGPFQGKHHCWSDEETVWTDAERFVVVSFYLGLMTASCLDLIGAAGATVVEGPFAKNPLFCSILSAATGRLVVPVPGTGTSIGAALLTVPRTANGIASANSPAPVSAEQIEYADTWKALVAKSW